jgi:hypothetical protein
MRREAIAIMAVFITCMLAGAAMGASPAFAEGDAQAFCSTLSEVGGLDPVAEAATSGDGAADLVKPLKKLVRAAPDKRLRSSLNTLVKVFKRIGDTEDIADLSAKDIKKLNKAMTRLSIFVAANC